MVAHTQCVYCDTSIGKRFELYKVYTNHKYMAFTFKLNEWYYRSGAKRMDVFWVHKNLHTFYGNLDV